MCKKMTEVLLAIGFTALGSAIGSAFVFWRINRYFVEEMQYRREMRKSAERSRNEQ